MLKTLVLCDQGMHYNTYEYIANCWFDVVCKQQLRGLQHRSIIYIIQVTYFII